MISCGKNAVNRALNFKNQAVDLGNKIGTAAGVIVSGITKDISCKYYTKEFREKASDVLRMNGEAFVRAPSALIGTVVPFYKLVAPERDSTAQRRPNPTATLKEKVQFASAATLFIGGVVVGKKLLEEGVGSNAAENKRSPVVASLSDKAVNQEAEANPAVTVNEEQSVAVKNPSEIVALEGSNEAVSQEAEAKPAVSGNEGVSVAGNVLTVTAATSFLASLIFAGLALSK